MSLSSTRTKGKKPPERLASLGGLRMDWKSDEVVKNLIEKGKESGSLTYDDLNAALPEGASDPDRLQDILELLDKNGISVIDADDAEDREEEWRRAWKKSSSPTPMPPTTKTPTATAATSTTRSACT